MILMPRIKEEFCLRCGYSREEIKKYWFLCDDGKEFHDEHQWERKAS